MDITEQDSITEINELMLKNEFAKQLLETQLNILIKEFEYNNHYNPVEHIKSRIKSEKSIREKLKKKGYEYNVHNLRSHVHDIVGIRIVCSFLSDVYDIVNMIKNSEQFKLVAEKDYIENPKDSGYISYHLIVLVPVYLNDDTEYIEAEIQIRTIAMDFWASIDHKIQYKFAEAPKEVQDELYQCSLDIKALDNRMNQLNKIIHKYENTKDNS